MSTETYKRVYIKGDPEKLPREKGQFHCFDLDDKSEKLLSFNPDNMTTVNYWRDWIGWYIAPIHEEQGIEEYYVKLGKWTKEAFPDAGSIEHLIKLHEETDEAISDPSDVMEYADCLGAILGAAYKAGFKFSELLAAAFDKLAVNKTRKWQKSENGTYQHIPVDQPKEQPVQDSRSENNPITNNQMKTGEANYRNDSSTAVPGTQANYLHSEPATFDDYMKCSKEELVTMLLECHRIIESQSFPGLYSTAWEKPEITEVKITESRISEKQTAEEIRQKIKQIIIGNIGISDTGPSQQITGLDDAAYMIAEFVEEYKRQGKSKT